MAWFLPISLLPHLVVLSSSPTLSYAPWFFSQFPEPAIAFLPRGLCSSVWNVPPHPVMTASYPHSFRLHVTSPLCPSLPPINVPSTHHYLITFLCPCWHICSLLVFCSAIYSLDVGCVLFFSVPLKLPPECKLTREGGLLISVRHSQCVAQ